MGFLGYYCRFIKDFAGLSEPLVALTRNGVAFAWTNRQHIAFDALKTCLLNAPILGLFAVGVFSISSRAIGRSSLHTLARVFAFLSDGIVLHAGRCWRRWSCVCIFGRTYGQPSSPCIRTIADFGGFRNFGAVMEC